MISNIMRWCVAPADNRDFIIAGMLLCWGIILGCTLVPALLLLGF